LALHAATKLQESGFSFGPFQLFPRARLLLSDGAEPVHLGSRAFDILVTLIERNGELASVDELMARVWPNMYVEEGSLRVHIAALRKALGDGVAGNRYIGNVQGRGYRLLLPIARTDEPDRAEQSRRSEDSRSRLPVRIPRLIGREDAVSAVSTRLSDRRFVTITGPGGVGKTTVAIAVLHALAPDFGAAVRFLNFSTLGNPLLLASTVASQFELRVESGDPATTLIGYLRSRRVLIVFDCCEHVIDAAAALAQRIVREAPEAYLIATSREPLRADGEYVCRLAPFATPPANARLTPAELMAFPVVDLFVERASANSSEFRLDEAAAANVAEICRRLDGIPLAIELAAARTSVFGVAAIANGLNDMFSLLTGGLRTALPRHQTLSATLDWSFDLLPQAERVVLRRLSVFRGTFSLESAVGLVSDAVLDAGEVTQCVGSLIAKSLIAADFGRDAVNYRLLDMTRAYAERKLAEGGEAADMAQRHAMLCVDVFRNAEADWESQTKEAWLGIYAGWINDLRAALDWTLSPRGDVWVCIVLTASSAPLWFALLLLGEFCVRAEQALQHVAAASLSGSELEMKLSLSLGVAIFNARGLLPRMRTVAQRALDIAERNGATSYQLRALWQLSRERSTHGDYLRAYELCEQFENVAIATGDPATLLVRDRMVSRGLHLVGRQADARVYAERALDSPAASIRSAHKSFNEYDNRVASRSHLASILFVQGFPDRASALAAEGVNHGLALGYPPATCHILAYAACPIAFWTGNMAAVGRYVRLLGEQTAEFPSGHWQSWRLVHEQVAALIEHEGTAAFDEIARTLLTETRGPYFLDMIATIRVELLGAAAIDRATARDSVWCIPEVLRAQGVNLLRRHGLEMAGQAEDLFRTSMELAQRQDALAWEMRTATSMGRLWRDQGRRREATDIVNGVLGKFTEGFGTADLLAARILLQELADS
jgi:predicted ATPase/DNA-binding winged helix-turn-helix (wHTH) protein